MRETQETGHGLRGRKTRVGMWQIADLKIIYFSSRKVKNVQQWYEIGQFT